MVSGFLVGLVPIEFVTTTLKTGLNLASFEKMKFVVDSPEFVKMRKPIELKTS